MGLCPTRRQHTAILFEGQAGVERTDLGGPWYLYYFREHVLAGGETVEHHGQADIGRHPQIHGVDLGVGEQFAVVAISAGDRKFFGYSLSEAQIEVGHSPGGDPPAQLGR